MKFKYQLIVMVCMALFSTCLVGCNDEFLPEVSEEKVQHFELTVTQAAPEPSSRLSLEADGLTTMWEPGDRLVLVDKARTNPPIFLACTLTEKATKASFVAETGVPAGDYYVVYNYNDKLIYGQSQFRSIDEINNQNKLTLWGEISIAEGISKASIQLQHMYAKVKFELKNIPGNCYYMHIGLYSPQKGFPRCKQFTNKGLVNVNYEWKNSMYGGADLVYLPSNERIHSLKLGNFSRGETMDLNHMFTESALIFPEDLKGEEVIFYAYDDSNCYEFRKKNVKFTAGTSYKVVLDFSTVTPIELKSRYENASEIGLVSTPAEWRAASYRRCYKTELTADLDFTNEIFVPMMSSHVDGKGHTIKNVTLNRPEEDNVGLMRYEDEQLEFNDMMESSYNRFESVSNLTLEHVAISGRNHVGALGGRNVSVKNCKLIGNSSITGSGDFVGGLVGYNNLRYSFDEGRTQDAYVGENTVVSGQNQVGGIIGGYSKEEGSTISVSGNIVFMETCVSKAMVSGKGNCVGGIVGGIVPGKYANNGVVHVDFTMNDYTLSFVKCANEGNVSGKNYVGGVIGRLLMREQNSSPDLNRITLKQSYSHGNITGETFVGGIVGENMIAVNTCYSRGTIQATNNTVGGIVGYSGYYMDLQPIRNSYSLADLKTPQGDSAGGILGKGGFLSIVNCYFAGTAPMATGIIGTSNGAVTVTNCLTTLTDLGSNLGEHSSPDLDENGNPYYNYNDVITNCTSGVTSIKDNKAVINSDNAYSDTYWSLDINPAYCLKFADFSIDTEAPGFGQETIN